jgi:hypothetical protein
MTTLHRDGYHAPSSIHTAYFYHFLFYYALKS